MTRHRDMESFDNLPDILHHLGDPEKVGKNNTWVAKNYSLAQLIKDLKHIEYSHSNSQEDSAKCI